MKTLIASLFVVFTAIAADTPPADTDKPDIKIIATGGTIAGAAAGSTSYGYKSGQFNVEDLIKAVPGMDKLADVTGEQVMNIGSQDMNDKAWLKLGKRLNEVAADPKVQGIVITHGTDTLEETSFFLDLISKTDKPIVMVGSMRPATAVSADGPGNLYNGVAVAGEESATGRGVLVVLNDSIHAARNVTKTDTTNVETFKSLNRGPEGVVSTGKVRWFAHTGGEKETGGHHTEFSLDNVNKLPRVDIIYAHANMSVDLIDDAVRHGAQGLVIAGVGDGNMTQEAVDHLAAAAKKGIAVVRSSRVPEGVVLRNNEINDDKLGFVSSGEFNPPKARVLLMLALTKTKDPMKIQKYFDEY